MTDEQNIEINLNDDSSWKKRFTDTMVAKLKQSCEELNVEWFEPQNETDCVSLISACQQAQRKSKIDAENRASPRGGRGTVRLSQEQLSEYDYEGSGEGYDSYKEMFDDLHRKLHSSSKKERIQAERALGQLSTKALKALKNRAVQVEIKIPSDADLERYGDKGQIGLVDFLNQIWKRKSGKDDD